MNAGSLKQRVLSNNLLVAVWTVVSAALSGLILLLAPPISGEDQKSASLKETAAPITQRPRILADPAWDRLSPVEQGTLEPLKDLWSSMTAEQQAKWRLVAERVQASPKHMQRRLASRIAEWARLTPQQRAHARLNFLELARHYNPRQRKAQWHAYQSAKPIQGHAVTGGARPRVVPPVFVQASPGATTVHLSQLYELPQTAFAEREEAALDPPQISEQSSQSMGAASAAAGSAADIERLSP